MQTCNHDHRRLTIYPSSPQLDASYRPMQAEARRNYRATDWEKYREVLQQKLSLILKPAEIRTKEELTLRVATLEETITSTTKEVVPETKPSPYRKRWWTPELT
jgi:hypothetical protein